MKLLPDGNSWNAIGNSISTSGERGGTAERGWYYQGHAFLDIYPLKPVSVGMYLATTVDGQLITTGWIEQPELYFYSRVGITNLTDNESLDSEDYFF